MRALIQSAVLQVRHLPIPHIDSAECLLVRAMPGLPHFYQAVARYGYMDQVDHGECQLHLGSAALPSYADTCVSALSASRRSRFHQFFDYKSARGAQELTSTVSRGWATSAGQLVSQSLTPADPCAHARR
jgi:hypothetical protein